MKVKDQNSTLWKYSKLVLLIADEFGIDAATAKNIITDIAFDEHDTLTDYLKSVDFGESEGDSWDEDDEEYDGSGCDACDDEDDEDADEDENDDDDYYDDEDAEDDDDSDDDDDENDELRDYPEDIETVVNDSNKIRIPARFMKQVFNDSDDIWDECSVFYHSDENKISIGKTGRFDYLFIKKNPGTVAHNYSNRGTNPEWGFNLHILKSANVFCKWLTIHYNSKLNTIEITW